MMKKGVKMIVCGAMAVSGNGLLILDEVTLASLGTEPEPRQYPEALTAVTADFPGMQVRWHGDIGSSAEKKSRYVLRGETLGTNRDRPREGPLPEGQDLVLYTIGAKETATYLVRNSGSLQ